MQDLSYYVIACYAWYLLFAIWIIASFNTKTAARRQTSDSRLLQSALTVVGFWLVFDKHPNHGWTTMLFLPQSSWQGPVGLALTLLGIALAIWSRVVLGRNWSGTVTVKQDHTLIQRAPYTLARHPMYTGLLLGMLGTAIIVDRVHSLLGVGVLFVGLWIKSRMEEQFMVEEFGDQYRQYQQRVKALIPYVF